MQLSLPATVTVDEASATLRALEDGFRREPASAAALTVDASALKQFDSSALAVLLACRRLAQAAGRGFGVTGAPHGLVVLAGLYGVDELIEISDAA